MENKNFSTTNKEDMMREISELQINISKVKADLYAIELEQTLENHKKSGLEAKQNNLSTDIEFYKNKAKKMGYMLSHKITKCSKFSMASQCYDKLMETYSQNYMENNLSLQNTNNLPLNNNSFDVQIEKLQQNFAELDLVITENKEMIVSLLEALEPPTE